MIKKTLQWGFACLSAFVMLAWGGLELSNSRDLQIFGELVTRAETADSIVALSFDDGPTPTFTDSVLAMLAEHKVKATFFVVGAAVERHPDIAARVVQAGHELGNHSYSHQRMVLKTPGTVRREIETTEALIRATGQDGEILFRPPYGKRLFILPWYLARRHRPVVLWDIEPDSYVQEADAVVAHVLERVRPGSIILLHVENRGRIQNRLALPQLVVSLQERGYRLGTVSEVLAR